MKKFSTMENLIAALPRYHGQSAIITFYKDTRKELTYRHLAEKTEQLGFGMMAAGINKGDRIVILSKNRPEWIVSCLAVMRIGAVPVPLDVQMDDRDLTHVFNDCGARFVFTTSDMMHRLTQRKGKRKPKTFLLDASFDHEQSWRHLLMKDAQNLPAIHPTDTAVLFYTSGTTGLPKGVPLSHENIAFQLNAVLDTNLLQKNDRLLLPLPFHHVYSLVVGLLIPLAAGSTIVIPYSLTGPQIIRAVKKGQATIIIGVPRLYSVLYANIKARFISASKIRETIFKVVMNISITGYRRLGIGFGKKLFRIVHQQMGPSLRLLACGGSSLDPELAWRLTGLGWQLAVGYGLTETSPLLTLNLPDSQKKASVGKPVKGVDIRIDTTIESETRTELREKGSPEKIFREGEILARGSNVFRGYHNLPDQTKEVFTPDKWFRTGDLGYFDREGYLYITGRVSTLIVTESGEKVQPQDVEDIYLESPVIQEIGILQRKGKLVALVVPEIRKIQGYGEKQIDKTIHKAIEERSQHVPSYKRISEYIVVRRPLPRTLLGKIRRHLLPALYDRSKSAQEKLQRATARPITVMEMPDSDRVLLQNEAAARVWKRLKSLYPHQRLTFDTSPQLDLGIDSLDWVNLSLEIQQQTKVGLTEEAINRITSIRDLLQEVNRASEIPGRRPRRVLLFEEPEKILSNRQKKWLSPLSPGMFMLAQCFYWLNKAVMKWIFNLRVEGANRLPLDRQWIITPNHTSYLDSFAIAATLSYPLLSRTHWGGWTGVAFKNPFNRFISRLAQAVPIDPERGPLSSIAFGALVLKQGKNLIWFPEGQRSTTGKLLPFKPGIGMLLAHFPVSVVPLSIKGTYEALPPGKIFPRLKRITLIYDYPVEPHQLDKQRKGHTQYARITRALHDHMAMKELRNSGRTK